MTDKQDPTDPIEDEATAALLGETALEDAGLDEMVAGAASIDSVVDDEVLAEEIAAADQVAAEAAAALVAEKEEDEDRRAVVAGWGFLGVVFAIFLGLVFWAYNLDDGAGEVASPVTTEAPAAQLTPTSLLFTVSEDGSVVLSGAVPDEGARRQLVEAATGLYGSGNVTDDLTIDTSVGLDGGTINTTGTAPHDDQNIGSLVGSAKQLGLTEGSLGVVFSEQVLTPVQAIAELATNTVTLSGAFPEQGSIDLFTAAANDAFGADNVDASGAFVDSSTTMQGATLLVSGVLDAGDSRGTDLVSALTGAFPGVTVDSSGLTVDTSPEALSRLEAKLRAAIELNPILFNSGSAEIDDLSAAILEQVATAVKAAPGIPVEVVGHTDDQGAEDLNQQLSESRATAVVDRLIELGVDPARLTARGAGESEPIADNGTEEGRAANRRIAFEFEGAAG